MFVDASIKLRQTPHSPNFDTGQSKRKNFKLERTRALRPEPYFDTNLFFSSYHLVMSWPLIDGKNTGEDKASGL